MLAHLAVFAKYELGKLWAEFYDIQCLMKLKIYFRNVFKALTEF